MNIPIEESAVRDIVQKAILQSLSADTKELLIANAIKHLMTPEKSLYGSGSESPLQRAWNIAMYNVALEECRNIIATDERVRQMMRSLVVKAWEKCLEDENECVANLAGALCEAMTPKGR